MSSTASMASTSLSSSTLCTLPLPAVHSCRKKLAGKFVVAASSGRGGYGGKLVDENMIVLRMRIREVKTVEKSDSPPSDWMEWEKRYYKDYHRDVCDAVGLLQSQLMNTRPSLALGFLAFITLSLPISTAVFLFQAMEMGKGILSWFI